jgi:hypothetical protein
VEADISVVMTAVQADSQSTTQEAEERCCPGVCLFQVRVIPFDLPLASPAPACSHALASYLRPQLSLV